MRSRVLYFVLAALALLIARVLMSWAQRRGKPFFQDDEDRTQNWNLLQLLLASFLTLFAELAFIRWISVEIRVFAYFKNLALLLCFVGFGLGCALAGRAIRWSAAVVSFLGLILIVRLPLDNGGILEHLSQSLGAAADVEIWATGDKWNWARFLVGALLAACLFALIVYVFVPLGQVVSRQMNRAPRPLLAYSWNLFGSLAGVLAFLEVSRLMLPPSFWLSVVLIGFAVLQGNRRDRVFVASLIVPLVLLLHVPIESYFKNSSPPTVLWTPYQQVQYLRYFTPEGDFWGAVLSVNHTGYQITVNLSSEYLARNPKLLKEPQDENPYNLAFRFAVPSPSVLVVGSGTGNDVAAALRHDSRSVDAVEIDPAILDLGRREHPEHPYDSPRVSVHLTDARAFLKRTPRKYDVILFGLLDSHTQFSDYSNMRIDNFVYTEESFREARNHLNPGGIVFIKFQVNHPWMGARLRKMLNETFGKPPVVFFAESSYSSGATCFVISPGSRVEDAMAADSRLANFAAAHAITHGNPRVPVTTDDWPYLYQEGRWIPRTFYSIGLLVVLLAIALYMQIGEARRQPPSLFFFAMGAGFLLLETQVISRLALFFGTTWQVNGIVISAMLCALLLANVLVEKVSRPIPRMPILIALLGGLGLAYSVPFDRIGGSATSVGSIATVVFAIPVFLAGILFASEFRVTRSPSAALGANMLGAVAGGLLENLSLIFGMRALLLVAMALYFLAGIGLRVGARERLPASEQSRELSESAAG
jgi:spermidine synthase